jgi:hypothetical protein
VRGNAAASVVKEQSHKHEMAAALRGDFARLRARGVDATIGASEPLESSPVAPHALSGQPSEPGEEAVEREAVPAARSSAWRLLGRR